MLEAVVALCTWLISSVTQSDRTRSNNSTSTITKVIRLCLTPPGIPNIPNIKHDHAHIISCRRPRNPEGQGPGKPPGNPPDRSFLTSSAAPLRLSLVPIDTAKSSDTVFVYIRLITSPTDQILVNVWPTSISLSTPNS